MSKIWFFIEGESEKYLVQNLLRNHYCNCVKLKTDITEFILTTESVAYCENCKSVDAIPHRISESYYQIVKSNADAVIVICDIEELSCSTERKNKIISKIENDKVN